MKILTLIYRYIGKNAILTKFFVILADMPEVLQPALNVKRKICNLPIVPDDHEFLAKFYSCTLRITDPGD